MTRFFTLRAIVGGLIATLLVVAFTRLFLDVSAASQRQASQQLLKSWERYARKLELPPEQISAGAEEAVRLMNTHSARAFPDRQVRFILWSPGRPAPPGYAVNPDPPKWEERDARTTSARARKPVPNNLSRQTDDWLRNYGYVTRLIGADVYVYRQGAFLPHLMTKMLRYDSERPGSLGPFFEVSPRGDARAMQSWLETGGVYMAPNTSVTIQDSQATFRLDEGSMDLATRLIGSNAVEVSRGKELQWQLRAWIRLRQEQIGGWFWRTRITPRR